MNELLLGLYDHDVDMRIDEYDCGVLQIRFKKKRHSRTVFVKTEDLVNNKIDVASRLGEELRVFLMCISKLEEKEQG